MTSVIRAEGAIEGSSFVGIADCVEAAVRSLAHTTVEQIESMIQKIIKTVSDDNQFNECDLTLRGSEWTLSAIR